MNYNASIRWHSGMMLSSQAFSQLQTDMTLRQQMAIRLALSDGRYGIVPDTPVHLDGTFVRKTYEMTGLQCTAVLPSGRLLSVDADLALPISLSNEDAEYYVALGFGSEERQYERDGVEYTEPEVILSIHTSNEIDNLDVMPIKHFIVKDGMLKHDDAYIVPSLISSFCPKFGEYLKTYADGISALAEHQNMEDGDRKITLRYYAFQLRNYDMRKSTSDLMNYLVFVSQSLEYYIVETLGKTIDEIPADISQLNSDYRRQMRYSDVNIFLQWMKEYVASLTQIMDKVVIEKLTIDTEAIKKEVYESLYPELHDALLAELLEKLKAQLLDELPEPLFERIKQYATENIVPELETRIHDNLRDPLYNDLYDALYKMIQDLLANFEFKQPDTFVPLI